MSDAPGDKFGVYEVDDDNDIKAKLREIAARLDHAMPEGWGFTLFLMSHGDTGAVFYLSSLERDGAIAAVETWLVKAKADKKRKTH